MKLYPYQERVLATLLSNERKNIILVVPTGGGKTLAALLPFLQDRAFRDGLLPEKLLYAVPMRVLATQFRATFKDLLKEELEPERFEELQTGYQRFGKGLDSLQTGETPEDPQLEAMIVSCTIDQLLASALGIPYSLGRNAANINVGAVCGSYLVLDEPHLYPLAQEGRSYKGALTTCLELLRLLHGITRFVFMSATMSSALVARLKDLLDAEVIRIENDEELAEINRRRERFIERSPVAMSAEQIVERHDRCSLVVCNTVLHAQEIYLQLDELRRQGDLPFQLKLIHSRFTDDDRRAQGEQLTRLLGKEQWKDGVYQGKNVIVVATQVVEVGLDISVQTLHTQLSPANSLIQRAGRCARFERQRGKVMVYRWLGKEGEPASSQPYDADLCATTWDALALPPFLDRPIGFREEQALVDLVHTEADLDLLKRYEDQRLDLQQDLTNCLQQHERSLAPELIRDVMQVQLLIHDDPESEITTEPWRWQSFSLHPSQLQGKHWEALRGRQHDLGPEKLMRYPELSPEAQAEEHTHQEGDRRVLATYTWKPLTGPASVLTSLMIALPRQLATYDKDLGLVFLDGRLALPDAWKERLEKLTYQSVLCPYRTSARDGQATSMQRYQTHINGLANAYYQGLAGELGYVMKRLEDLLGLQTGLIDRAIQFAIATHDLGKLDQQWQTWARAWQRLYMQEKGWTAQYREPERDYFFAKTNYDYRDREQKAWQQKLTEKRPHHACESVRAAENVLAGCLEITDERSPNLPLLRAACYAIAHHHTPLASEYGATTIHPSALVAIEKAIQNVRRDATWAYDLHHLDLTFGKGDHAPANASTSNQERVMTLPKVSSSPSARPDLLETWLAFVMTRALRLADQRADRYVQ